VQIWRCSNRHAEVQVIEETSTPDASVCRRHLSLYS
jgi:hypothetical protein